MRAITQEWVKKAEGDFHSAARECRARVHPNYDAACFHCPQCIEKYLKAFLQEHMSPFPKTHSLVLLVELCVQIGHTFQQQRSIVEMLDKYAVDIRYPGEFATKAEALEALETTKLVRTFSRKKLGLRASR